VHPKIKHMVKKMEAMEKSGERAPDKGWYLYILRCSTDTYYTGVTKDLKRRLKMHNDGKASKYTRVRRPVKLIYSEDCTSRATALVREYKVKALPRKEKERLIFGKTKSVRKGRKNG